MNIIDSPAMPELTDDKPCWFSVKYTGLSPRIELWGITILSFIWGGIITASCEGIAKHYIIVLLEILFLWPLFVRRARQMGATWYGVVAIVVTSIPFSLIGMLFWDHTEEDETVLLIENSVTLFVNLLVLPLFIFGGALAGRKNALMRAAIAGNLDEAARLMVE